MITKLRHAPTESVHLVLMLALSFATGIIDAVGYLGLDRVFTGNMTGNVVILGMALLGADGLPVLGPLVALAGFVAGAAGGGRVLKGADGGWTQRVTGLFAVTALVEWVVGVGLLTGLRADERPVQVGVVAVVGAAMGVQAATARSSPSRTCRRSSSPRRSPGSRRSRCSAPARAAAPCDGSPPSS
jgi:uncharacterized membrane protein YoaK (UPF0700 family)